MAVDIKQSCKPKRWRSLINLSGRQLSFFIKQLDGDVHADEHIQQAMMINTFGKLGIRVESQAGFREIDVLI
jgi:hypothetical protein